VQWQLHFLSLLQISWTISAVTKTCGRLEPLLHFWYLDYQCICQLSLGTWESQCPTGSRLQFLREQGIPVRSLSLPRPGWKLAIVVSMVTVAPATLYPGTCEIGTRVKSSSGSIFWFRLIEQGSYTSTNPTQTHQSNTVKGIYYHNVHTILQTEISMEKEYLLDRYSNANKSSMCYRSTTSLELSDHRQLLNSATVAYLFNPLKHGVQLNNI
jgi:hypothetical protein